MLKDDYLKKLFDAADAHGEDSGEPDHTIGDLQDLVRAAWNLMTVAQKRDYLGSPEVEAVIEMGARDAFDVEGLQAELEAEIQQMHAEVEDAGYEIRQSSGWFFWENDDDAGDDVTDEGDAVIAAHAHMKEAQAKAHSQFAKH